MTNIEKMAHELVDLAWRKRHAGQLVEIRIAAMELLRAIEKAIREQRQELAEPEEGPAAERQET